MAPIVVAMWFFFGLTLGHGHIILDLEAQMVAAVNVGEIEFVSGDMDCYNLRLGLAEPEDTVTITEKKKEILSYYCTEAEKKAREKRALVGLVKLAMKSLSFVYDAYLHYSFLELQSDVDLLKTNVASIELWNNTQLKEMIEKLQQGILMTSDRLKIKMFSDFLRAICIDNRILDARILKANTNTDFIPGDLVYPHDCNVTGMSMNLSTCVPEVTERHQLYNVHHMGFVDKKGQTKMELKLPSMMVFAKDDNGAYKEYAIEIAKCQTVSFRRYRCRPEARVPTTCRIFSAGTCETRIWRGLAQEYTMQYSSNIFLDEDFEVNFPTHFEGTVEYTKSGATLRVREASDLIGKLKKAWDYGFIPALAAMCTLLLGLLLLKCKSCLMTKIRLATFGSSVMTRIYNVKKSRIILSTLNDKYIDSASGEVVVRHGRLVVGTVNHDKVRPIAVLRLRGKSCTWTIYNMRSVGDLEGMHARIEIDGHAHAELLPATFTTDSDLESSVNAGGFRICPQMPILL
uniref:Glycoprotein n=1 Tax=Steinernema glaseri TaxID=37863 RepID=A0A1I8AFQ1_9BILA